MKPYRRRRALESIFRRMGWAQFGQKHDSTTDNGREACTHVVCQALVYLDTGKEVTIDELSEISGYVPDDEGMNSTHVDRIVKHFKLPLVASWRMPGGAPSTLDLITSVREMGPALIGVPYGKYPLDAGFAGTRNEAIQGGRSDLGFAGNHAVCLFAIRWLRKSREYRPRLMDPDHGSKLRPNVPDFDIVKDKQLARLWESDLVGKPYGQFGYLRTTEWTGVPET